jgi:glycosyltransferase involved in cell wall biosynthesis
VGRLSEEKGIRTLLDVASSIPNKLKILGTGPLAQELQDIYRDCTQIEFMGFQNWDVCRHVIESASFSVMPSECYENYPFAVIESLCLGTPVLGANIGGIPELIKEGVTGELFESGNKQELVEKLQIMMGKKYSFNYESIAEGFSKEAYLTYLLNLYSGVAK